MKWWDRKGTPGFPTAFARQGQTGATSCAVEKRKKKKKKKVCLAKNK